MYDVRPMARKGFLARYELGPIEVAILEMTNDPKVRVSRKSKTRHAIVTNKDAYFWAAFVTFLAESTEVEGPALTRVMGSILSDINLKPEEHRVAPFPAQMPDALGLWIGIETLRRLNVEISEGTFRSIIDRAALGYSSALRKGLIEDPLVITVGGIATLVLGLVPVSFTKKTKNGKVVSRRIKALYWKWEQSERAGVMQTNVEFRVLKLLRAFNSALTSVLDQDEH
jgi:hypothetical protein